MRHLYYTFFLLIFSIIFTHNIFPQYWSEQTITPTPPKLNCVSAGIIYSSNNGQGWIGGDSGTILYTSNDGYNWVYRNNSVVGTNNVNVIQIVYGPLYTTFYSRAFCSANSSTTTYIYRTTNQGLNWSIVYQQTGGRIRGIYMLDTNNGYAVGDPVGCRWTILKTSNGGSSFDSSGLYIAQAGSEISNYNTFYVASLYPSNLILFGTNTGRLYRSTNSGANWSFITLPFQNVYAITLGHYPDGISQGYQTGYAVGNGAQYTTDYGATWSTVTLPGTGDIHAFYYDLIESPGYACYSKGSQIYSTTNSSLSFTLSYTSPNGGNYIQMSLQLFMFEFGYRGGWAVKDNGTVSVYNHLIVGIQKISSDVPKTFSLYQNYPNPFNPTTKIKFSLPEVRNQTSEVRLEIFDLLGNQIATLVNERLTPGTYEVAFDGSNYASGIYFYKLQSGDFSETKKLLLMK